MMTRYDAYGNPRRWWERETVRVRGYSVGTAVIGLLVLRDIVTSEEAGYLLMAVAAILGVYGIESSRGSTTSDAIVRDVIVPAARRGDEDTVEMEIQRPREDRDNGL